MVHPKLAVGLWASHSASLSLFILLQNVAKDSTAWDWYESRIGEIVSFNYFLSICYTVVTLIGVQDISVNNMGKNELHLSARALSRNPSGRHSSIPRVHPLLRTDVPTPRPDAGVTVPHFPYKERFRSTAQSHQAASYNKCTLPPISVLIMWDPPQSQKVISGWIERGEQRQGQHTGVVLNLLKYIWGGVQRRGAQ